MDQGIDDSTILAKAVTKLGREEACEMQWSAALVQSS